MYCTQNSNSAKRHNGQLVRKLFQPVELSTVVQKEKIEFCINALDWILTHPDSVSSERFGVGYAHPNQEMDNTVFPPAHSAYGLELMTATKVPQ